MHEELPGDAVVIRGGQLDAEKLRKRAEKDRQADGTYVLSMWAGVKKSGETVEDLLERLVAEGPIPHTQLNLTTAEALRAAGFQLAWAPDPDCHYDLKLGNVMDPGVIARFIGAFTQTRRNLWKRPS